MKIKKPLEKWDESLKVVSYATDEIIREIDIKSILLVEDSNVRYKKLVDAMKKSYDSVGRECNKVTRITEAEMSDVFGVDESHITRMPDGYNIGKYGMRR